MNVIQLIVQTLSAPDAGPIYRETKDFSDLIVEPWNAFSSLTFWIPAFIFLWQLRGKYRQQAFMVYFCIPLLIVGGLGSTLFHAFRSSGWLLLMDVLPIILLVLGVSIVMWLKVLPKKWIIFPILAAFFGLTYLASKGQDRISAGYLVRGTMLLLPCLLFLFRSHFKHASQFFYACFALVLALLFRYADEKFEIGFMPWGTHWLWHVSTAFGAYFLGEYLIRIQQEK